MNCRFFPPILQKSISSSTMFLNQMITKAVFGETKPIVTSVLDGYNVCIFAYGQTGTGKTFTMEGTPENRGVNYRTLEELFRISEERKGYMKYELYVSMLEVYNEKLRDLLVENSKEQSKRLDIKQAADGTQEVPGLIESHVSSTEEVWKLLQSGNCCSLLRVTVKGESLIDGQKTRSHLWLVDLAGSERVGKIEVEGERLKESQFINKSLSALGDTSHIPFRNSKLTHMLQSSLGEESHTIVRGDCKTLMFVQISPSSSDLGETLCSLNFATRVRGIENGPARKHADLNELYKYKQMAEKMKHDEKETKKLQDSVQSLQLRLTAKDSMFRSLQEKARDLENQLEEERRARIKQENRVFPSTKQQPSTENNNNNTITTKPPLCPPSKLRMPLRRITNFMPQQQQQPPPSAAVKGPSSATTWKRKENNNVNSNNNNNSRNNLMKPRRNSVAVRPPPPPSSQSQQVIRQPKRRVSVATYIPEQSVVSTPRVQQMLRGPRRGRFSSLFSPLPKSEIVGTPAAARFSSSKFMGSPPVVPGSWKPKHPTVVALQRKKSLVWSPLRGMMKNGGGGRSRPSYIAAMNQRN
ncbi:Kinesin-like protein KIN-14S [Linum perenne]